VTYRYLRFFDSLGLDDLPLVGGKNASLGEMYRTLTPKGIRIPYGFAVTTDAYRDVLAGNRLGQTIDTILGSVRAGDVHGLEEASRSIGDAFRSHPLPAALSEELARGYEDLERHYGQRDLAVAVRSSATSEDLPEASFAGQQESYLNVHGADDVLARYRDCLASLFTARAINYRFDHGFDHHGIALSVGIMKMVRADLGSSGVMFTLDTESGYRDVVFLNASYGLGESIVQGTVDPDEYYVHKPTRRSGYRSIVRRRLGAKKTRMIYATDGRGTAVAETEESERTRFSLSDDQVLALADQALVIEDHYSARNGRPTPMDIEWAYDGEDHRLYILQARPETVASRRTGQLLEEYVLDQPGEVLLSGRAVGERIGAGVTVVATSLASVADFPEGAVLVADTTTPDWEPIMKRAAAIVTNRGGRTCHAAIVARELGIPAVVGTQDGTRRLTSGMEVTVSCAEGDTGRVYRGRLPFRVLRTDLSALPRPKTKIMLNIGNPDLAFRLNTLPCDGVGLARLEFIISQSIRVHPLALLHPERVKNAEIRAEIARLTAGYTNGSEYFVHRLAEGMATIAAAFYPRPVIVRLSDFKSNEYAALVGGGDFEPHEENPMLGFRGASRYTHPSYREAFALECAAARHARETLGLDNIVLMVPFVRRVEEARRVLEVMAEAGLARSRAGLKIYMMTEIPNNVLQADAFAELFDGFSIGSNDLTQLTLGIDRDSDIIAELFDERDPGVLMLIRGAIEAAHRHGIYIGLCGQAPSDHPDMARLLVELGIDSISLNPDSVLKTTRDLLDLEARLKPKTSLPPRARKAHARAASAGRAEGGKKAADTKPRKTRTKQAPSSSTPRKTTARAERSKAPGRSKAKASRRGGAGRGRRRGQ
jgi:pyruvate,water dikinase